MTISERIFCKCTAQSPIGERFVWIVEHVESLCFYDNDSITGGLFSLLSRHAVSKGDVCNHAACEGSAPRKARALRKAGIVC